MMDEAEFDDFYTASFARITGQLYAMIGDRDEAQECVQEAFVRAWSHRRRLDRADHPEAWVRTTAYRLAVSRWRRTMRGRRPADRAVSLPTSSAAPSEAHVAVVAALKQLPQTQRRALVLHHIADLPVAQIAHEVGAPEGTVKAWLSRGRAALAVLLADDHLPAAPGVPGPDTGASRA
jgi:RNA polymerase sigma-70 factor, ECF subfamily